MAQIQGKKLIPMFVEESIYREIKVYAAETDKTIQEIVRPLTHEFEQSALRLVTEIREMKKKAEEKRLQDEENAKISAENPLKVPGHVVDPIAAF